MAMFSKLVITHKGRALIAKILSGVKNVNFTSISSSNAEYTIEQLENLTSISDIKQTSFISEKVRTNDVTVKIEAVFNNLEVESGYYMRTIGLYAIDPDEGEILYGVAIETSGNCYVPPYNGITVSGTYIQLVITVGNAENVSLEVDPGAVATMKQLNKLADMLDTHIHTSVCDIDGSHDLRYYNGKLQVFDFESQTWSDAGAGSEITVDGELSDTSTNPVENKVITAALNKKAGEKVEGMTFTVNGTNVTAAEGAERFNSYSNEAPNIAVGKYAVAMVYRSKATGDYSFAAGQNVSASGTNSVAIGQGVKSEGLCSTAFGANTTATGNYSFANGFMSTASKNNSIAMGNRATASETDSIAIGNRATASGYNAVAIGYYVTADAYNTAIGRNNKTPTAGNDLNTMGDLFIVGNGTETSKSNAFRITTAGKVMGTQAYTASGADYAEMFEWIDGNPDNEDRRGLFVTLDGEKIRPANADDDYILGVVSATPSVVADAQTDDWKNKWKTDVFGERLLDENGAWILNENFREEENKSYISRLDRKEWAAVGLVGKLIVVDDGTCEVNGYCSPANGGIATKSVSGCRVLSRIDENHIKVLIK